MLFLGSDSDGAEGDELEGGEEVSSLPTWLYFLRNGCVLLFSVWDAVEFGLVYEMAASWDIPIPISASESPHTFSLISYFNTLIPSTTITTDFASNNEDNTLWDEDVIVVYKEAATSLASALTIALLSPSSSPSQCEAQLFTPWLALRIWPMKLTLAFLSLLCNETNPHPAALILLAHYCLVLRRLDGCWYFYGGAKELLGSVLKRLDERWRRCVEWPIRDILGVDGEEERRDSIGNEGS
jgi:hypothetical protein